MKLTVRKPAKADGTIKVSGDKSISHRALLIGAIANGETKIKGFSQGGDCRSTLNCLKSLGADIKVAGDCIIIQGRGLKGFIEPDNVLDCGNSGTTMRMLSGLLSGQNFASVLTGDDSLRNRPMKRVIEPLTKMNARIWSRSGDRAPLSILGNSLRSIEYALPVASAQIKSALIFAGMQAEGITVIEEPVMTRDHTERMLIEFGAVLERAGNRIKIEPGDSLNGREILVPGDISSAAFFIVLASIMPESRITIQNTGVNPTRAGIIQAMQSMGADIISANADQVGKEPIADLIITSKNLQGIEIKGEIIPTLIDELPVIAVAATQAQGKTVISDAGELRVKETDRIKAIVQEMRKMGAVIQERKDGFVVEGPCDLHGAVCTSYNDHRIAMALSIAGLNAGGETIIENAECIDISFPEFIPLIREVCGDEAVSISE